MDGTLTDSIQAVKAAWRKVALDLGHDPEYVIAATHSKWAIDKPSIQEHEMEKEVVQFEESILKFADAYHTHGPGASLELMSPTIPHPIVVLPLSHAQVLSGRSRLQSPNPTWCQGVHGVTPKGSLCCCYFGRNNIRCAHTSLSNSSHSLLFLPFILAYGCMDRVGVDAPEVAITADDKRLKAGKPEPDPSSLRQSALATTQKTASSSKIHLQALSLL